MIGELVSQAICHKGDPTPLWYFLSALAQCAAAFAALTGLFAVFRFQATGSKLAATFGKARDWLSTRTHMSADVARMEDSRVRREIFDIRNGRAHKTFKDDVELVKIANEIQSVESSNSKVALELTAPLKFWCYIFLFSIGLLPLAALYVGIAWILVLGFLIASIYALYVSAKFIQECVRFD